LIAKENLTHETSFIVHPKDTQSCGLLFGGKILAEMDLCAAQTARRVLYQTEKQLDLLTVGVDEIKICHPAELGDLIFLRGKIMGLGITSIEVFVEVQKETRYQGERITIAHGSVTLVTIHPLEQGKLPLEDSLVPHELELPNG